MVPLRDRSNKQKYSSMVLQNPDKEGCPEGSALASAACGRSSWHGWDGAVAKGANKHTQNAHEGCRVLKFRVCVCVWVGYRAVVWDTKWALNLHKRLGCLGEGTGIQTARCLWVWFEFKSSSVFEETTQSR